MLHLNKFIGQKDCIDDLKIHVTAAIQSSTPLEHAMFYGPAGLGKTKVAQLISKDLVSSFVQRTGQDLKKKDLQEIFNRLGYMGIFFIDEIHSTPRKMLELLYSPLQMINDFKVEGKIPIIFQSESYNIKPFTLIGATTSAGSVPKPLRDRIILQYNFQYYTIEQLSNILIQRGCPPLISFLLSSRSRGTPRIALNHYLRLKNMKPKDEIDGVRKAYEMFQRLDIDEDGFDSIDRKIIKYLKEHRVASENELHKALGIDKNDYNYMHEPFLLNQGIIRITTRGRMLTRKGIRKG